MTLVPEGKPVGFPALDWLLVFDFLQFASIVPFVDVQIGARFDLNKLFS